MRGSQRNLRPQDYPDLDIFAVTPELSSRTRMVILELRAKYARRGEAKRGDERRVMSFLYVSFKLIVVHAEFFADRADNCTWVVMESSDMVLKHDFVLMAFVANCAFKWLELVMDMISMGFQAFLFDLLAP